MHKPDLNKTVENHNASEDKNQSSTDYEIIKRRKITLLKQNFFFELPQALHEAIQMPSPSLRKPIDSFANIKLTTQEKSCCTNTIVFTEACKFDHGD